MARNSGIWEILRNSKCSTWILARKLKNMQNETQTLDDLEYARNAENFEK
jgi:hypothetical protein